MNTIRTECLVCLTVTIKPAGANYATNMTHPNGEPVYIYNPAFRNLCSWCRSEYEVMEIHHGHRFWGSY